MCDVKRDMLIVCSGARTSSAQAKNRESRQSAVEEEIEELKEASDELVIVQEEKKALADQKRNDLYALETKFAEQSETLEAKKVDFSFNTGNMA